jgi:hypothetical protein
MTIVSLINSKILNLKITNRVVVGLGTLLLLVPSMRLTALAQPSPSIIIDRMFRYDSSPAGSNNQDRYLVISLKKWLGTYQRVIEDDNNYVAVFDRASIPLKVKLKDSGDIESFNFGCPVSKSVSLNEAPLELKKLLSKCNGSR